MFDISIRQCELCTRLKDDDGNDIINIEIVNDILTKHSCIDKYAYVIHNQDVYTDEDKCSKNEVGSLKPAHIHCIMHFDSPQQIEYVAKWFGLNENFVQKIKGRLSDALKYLVHQNAHDKYQYSYDDVIANFDVQAYLAEKSDKQKINEVIEKILTGQITEYNRSKEIDLKLLARYVNRIDNAFAIRMEYLSAMNKNRDIECVYIYGEPGTGKTTYAKEIARNKKMDFFISSGSNDILYGYRQEPCIILDDLRTSSLSLSDLLKLLDNHTSSTVKSRYHNKYISAGLIIITSVLSIEEFYSKAFQSADEPISQLKRRCRTHIKMSYTKISIVQYDNKLQDYDYSQELIFTNQISKQYVEKQTVTNQKCISGLLLPEMQQLNNEDGFCDIEKKEINPFK